MKNSIFKLSFSTLVLFFLGSFVVGCSADSLPKLEPYEKRVIQSKAVVQDFSSEVDILFIIDDSGSMADHQAQLSKNMANFIQSFFKVGFIDFHIGVTTSTYRSDRFFGGRAVAERGQLRSDGGWPFIERTTPNAPNLLSRYVEVGTTGHNVEHFLDILSAALNPFVNPGNKGFLRPDSHFLVVFLTDTDDQSGESARGTYAKIVSTLGGDPSRLNVAAALSRDSSCESEMFPVKLEEFAKQAGGTIFDLCSDYGGPLAKVAEDLVTKASTISLDQIPDLSTLVLTYGTQTIPEDPVSGWSYNAETNQIFLGPDIDLKPEPKGTSVQFFYEPVYK